MKKLIWSVVLVASVVGGAHAQKSEVNEAKKKWGIFQVVMNQSTDKQLELLNGGLKHTDAAIAHDKTKNTAEAWAYRAVFASSIAVVDTVNFDNAAKHLGVAEEAIKSANSFTPTDGDKELLTIATENLKVYKRSIGFTLYDKKDYKGAYNAFVESLKENPTDTAMYGNIALVASLEKNYPEALNYYRKGIDIGSKDSKSYYQSIFNIQIEILKDTTAALATVQEASSKYPDEVYFLANEADLYMKAGNYNKTFEMMDKLLAKEPENLNFLRIKADTYFNQAFDFQEQVRKLEIEKKYKEADEFIKKKIESLNSSLPLYLKVETLNPKDKDIIQIIRNVYFALDNTEKASEYTKKMEAL